MLGLRPGPFASGRSRRSRAPVGGVAPHSTVNEGCRPEREYFLHGPDTVRPASVHRGSPSLPLGMPADTGRRRLRCSSRRLGRVSSVLNRWQRVPLTHRPEMVGQPGCHRWRPFSESPLLVSIFQRPNRPPEVTAVHRKIGHRLVHASILTERIRLANLADVAMAVRRVVPLQERHVDPPADLRARSAAARDANVPNIRCTRNSTIRPNRRRFSTVA